MICPICGKDVDESLKTCDICGAALESEYESAVSPVTDGGAFAYSEQAVSGMGYVPYGQIPQGDAPQIYGAPLGNGHFNPPVPMKKKMKKWPIVLTCCVLAVLIAGYSIFSAILSQPMFVLTLAYNETFVNSQSLSFDVTLKVEGEKIKFDGEYVRGETPEENLLYFVMDDYMKLEAGYYNGKLYSSFGEFDLEDSNQWSDVEETLEEEYGVEADVEDIYMRLTADDITLEEQAAIYDEEIFPIVEEIIYVVYGEDVDFPPYLDIMNAFTAFFADFLYTYVVIEEKESDEGHLYSYEIDFKTVAADFHSYMETEETMSQLADILDVVYEEWETPFEEIEDSDGDLVLDGEIFVNDDGYIDTVDGSFDGVDFSVRFHSINETELDESDIKDIDVLFDINEMYGLYEDEDIPVA